MISNICSKFHCCSLVGFDFMNVVYELLITPRSALNVNENNYFTSVNNLRLMFDTL